MPSRSKKVYHDDARSEVVPVPDSAPPREIDVAIVSKLGEKAKIAMMIPPLMHCYNPSHKRLTIQFHTLTRFSLKHGHAAHTGKFKCVESSIHVLDLARVFITVLDYVTQTSPTELLDNPYFFCETTGDNEPYCLDIPTHIGKSLHETRPLPSPEPRELAGDLLGDVFGDFTGAVIVLNSHNRANRLRALGWMPQEKDWRASYVEDELPEISKEEVGNLEGYRRTVAS